MGFLGALLVFLMGYVSGRITRMVAVLAAIVALVLAVAGFTAPEAFFRLVDPILSHYYGNELLFLSGFLFGIVYEEWRR